MRRLWLSIVALFIISCTAQTAYIRSVGIPHVTYSVNKKMPIDIELRISSEINNLKREIKPTSFTGSAYSFPIVVGSALSQTIECVTKMHFKHVHKGNNKKCNPAIMFDLVRFEPRITFTGGLFSTGAHVSSDIALQVTITDHTGNQVFSTIVQGDSFLADDQFLGGVGHGVPLLEKTTRKAIENAMQQLSMALSNSRQLHDVFEK